MLNIYLARHGQDKDNANGVLNGRRDKPLTKLGIKQAEETAAKIKELEIEFNAIYSSPLQRAYQTAKIIADSLDQSRPKKIKELIERDFGIMTGKPHTKIKEICSPNILETEKVTYFLSPDGAETFPELVKRAESLLKKLKRKHENGNILLVSHGDFGKMIYCAYYDLDWKEVLKMFHFGNSELLLMSSNSDPSEAHVFRTKQYNN